MTVKFISENTKEARLAKRRVMLIRDETCHASNFNEEVYAILVEEWNNEDRQFESIDSVWELYGLDDVIENIIGIVRTYDIDCFVVDNELGDPNDWEDYYREFEVEDFS